MPFKQVTLAMAVAMALSGCAATIPAITDSAKLSTSEVHKIIRDGGWGEGDPVVQDGAGAFVLHMPVTPPRDVKNKKFSIEMQEAMSLKDVVQLLSRSGIPVAMGDALTASAPSSPGAGAPGAPGAPGGAKGMGPAASDAGALGGSGTTGTGIFIPRYTGTVGGFLGAVSRVADVWFTWQDGMISVSPYQEVVVTVPQDDVTIKAMTAALKDLQADGISASQEAGMLVFKLRPSAVPKVKAYLERAVANSALVTLQIAMVSVTINQDAKQGIDWNSLQMAAGLGVGNAAQLLSGLAAGAAGSATATATAGATGATGSASTSTDPGAGLYFKNGGLMRAAFGNKNFSLIGFINFLNKYGNARTVQNATATSLASHEVNLSSVTKVPYVQNVSATTTGTTGGNVMGSTSTATANDGVTLKLTPLYDRGSNMVTLPIDINVEAVLGFNDLSAGSQVGTLSQPTTGSRAIKDTLRMRPGETMIIGGINYDSLSRSDGLPLFLQGLKGKGLETQTLNVSRNSVYIVIRPTVRLTPPIKEVEGLELSQEAPDGPQDFLPSPADEEDSAKPAPAKKESVRAATRAKAHKKAARGGHVVQMGQKAVVLVEAASAEEPSAEGNDEAATAAAPPAPLPTPPAAPKAKSEPLGKPATPRASDFVKLTGASSSPDAAKSSKSDYMELGNE